MPGIETAAPERTETSSGFSAPPKLLPVAASSRWSAVLHLGAEPRRELLRLEIGAAELAAMVKPGGTGMPRFVISARPAPLPPRMSFMAARAVGTALAEEVDQRLR